ncbi:MAG: TetR/AcrR family transcriptional regulator [Myxococcales bacterium]|jgi:TetR/AcrR family transcriptional repressor of nem operon|nr:TetR/AcrR family transcriptional regulator [Sphingomicrobium sp.]
MSRNTRDLLMETATGLVRRQGYSAFSYADLSDVVGIRKASIHHHFPSKEDLGEAVVDSYTASFSEKLDQIHKEASDPLEQLQRYAELYREGLGRKEACLCGVLASEIAVLPDRVQKGVRRFMSVNLDWLEKTLEDDSDARLRPDIQPRRDARTVLSALQGALIIGLSTRDPAAFDETVEGLLNGLRSPERRPARARRRRQH